MSALNAEGFSCAMRAATFTTGTLEDRVAKTITAYLDTPDPNPTAGDMRVLALETVERSLRQCLSSHVGNEAKVWVMVAEHAAGIAATFRFLED